jgi:hypothetical protein
MAKLPNTPPDPKETGTQNALPPGKPPKGKPPKKVKGNTGFTKWAKK